MITTNNSINHLSITNYQKLNMNASANKGINNNTPGGQAQAERKVETVDYRVSAGQGQEQMQRVQIVHQPHSPPMAGSNTSGSILANAAASVAATLQSAKDDISRN
ncbi:hypothetical protein CASFOL_011503 [Castilleja foliolosa]|uniref:Uncharacterized protein n=1 Tax=Castilleja foliolosa TaxID=1961234 RepID=A0ABD3DW29_9LAMI